MRWWFLLVLGSVPAVTEAQEYRATIAGQVTDSSHAAIPGATVKAIQRSTNTVTEAKTNSEGYYTLGFLQPNTYDIEVIADGFNRLRREGIVLMVADKIDLPLTLEVGKVTESVTVQAEQETIQTGNASGGLNFDEVMTSEYALNGRQVYMLMDLTPGVIFTQEQFGVSGYSGTRGWDVSGAYVMNGGVTGSNQFLLNGAPISLTGTWQIAPNMEAIQEFKVMTNTYDAQYGRTGGGTVNTTVKAGTNAWHGSVFEYLRNSILDSNVTQNNRVGAPRGKHITNQFGSTLGGAMRRDKDFFFASFEGFRERVPFPNVLNTPPLDVRDGQHFSQWGFTVFDPLTVHTCVKGVDTSGGNCSTTYIRNPFPGNVIPQSRFSTAGTKILALMPAPNGPGFTQNYFATNNVGVYRYDQPMFRWDHIAGSMDRIYALLTYQHGQELRNQGFQGEVMQGNIFKQRTPLTIVAAWTHILSPSMILDIRASYGRFTDSSPDSLLDSSITAAFIGMTGLPHSPNFPRGLPPRIEWGQFTGLFGSGGNKYSWTTTNQWNMSPSLTQTHGKHTRKYGFEVVYAGIGQNATGRATGDFTFKPTWTTQYATRQLNKSDGSEVADLLLGFPTDGYLDYYDTYYRTAPYFAWYVQDDWKLLPRLTLNLGLRYDIQAPWVERWDRVNSGFDFNAVSPVSKAVLARWAALKAAYDKTKPQFPYPDPPQALLGGKTFLQPGGPRRTYRTDLQNIQPRIGIAWNFAPRSVLRAGFGIYHRTMNQANSTDGFSQRTDYVQSLDGNVSPSGATGAYTLENPFPNGIITPSGRSLGLLTNIGNAVNVDGAQLMIPRTFQYSFGLQQRVRWNTMIEAKYVGSITNHDLMAYQMDYYDYTGYLIAQKTNSYYNRKLDNPFYGILPVTSTQGASPQIAAQDLFRPMPQFAGVNFTTNPWASYRYDALQLSANKRFFGSRKTGALTLIFSYTFSKAWQRANRLNTWNLNEPPVHELTQYDKPQTLAFSGVWDLPFGRNRLLNPSNRAVSAIAGGWGTNWVYKFNSGYPIAMGNWVFLCDTYLLANQDHDHWFNNTASCYKSVPGFTPRMNPDRFSSLRQMDNHSLNVALTRTFNVTERYRLQFRGEAFNAMNHPLYGSPPSTSYTADRFGMLPLAQQNFPRLVQLAMKVMF